LSLALGGRLGKIGGGYPPYCPRVNSLYSIVYSASLSVKYS
jgi:hypothetical protein